MANTVSAVAAASSNLRTFGTKSGTSPKSAARIAQDLMRSKGISGLYKGLGATLLRYISDQLASMFISRSGGGGGGGYSFTIAIRVCAAQRVVFLGLRSKTGYNLQAVF